MSLQRVRNNFETIIKQSRTGLLYFLVYAIVLVPILNGVGNYWDWTFPYFTQGLRNFSPGFQSIVSDNFGTPLSYASNIYFTKIVSFFGWTKMPPELFLYLFLVIIFAVASTIFFRLARTKLNPALSFLLGLAVVLNPAVFYKLLAGHLNYLVSYTLFIYLISFVLTKYKNDLRSAVTIGLALAFIGFQIQFFFFAALFLSLYFIIVRPSIKWSYALFALVIPLLINLPWLTNFLLGVNSVANLGSAAAAVSFSGSSETTLVRIAAMIFSDATVIQYVYSKWNFAYFLVFSVAVGICFSTWLIKARKEEAGKNRVNGMILSLLLLFVILGTGFFHKFPVAILSNFYSIFRESGHFAPIIVLFELMSLVFLLQYLPYKKIWQTLGAIYLIGFIAINAYHFYHFLPKVDYSHERIKFESIEKFNKNVDNGYRILTYPFWNQYGFLDQKEVVRNDRLLNNSGWDNYTIFSGKDFVNNYAAGGQSIENSLQYRLLKTYDIKELEEKNVRYIYDLSSIYQSHFDGYTAPETYFNNIALIRNDKDFLKKIYENNPGRTKFVADNILELTNSLPRVYVKAEGVDKPIAEIRYQKISNSEYQVNLSNLKGQVNLVLSDNFNKQWKVYSKDPINIAGYVWAKPMADESNHQKIFGYANQWTIDSASLSKEEIAKTNPDGSVDLELTLYFRPQSFLSIGAIISFLTILTMLILLVRKQKNNLQKN